MSVETVRAGNVESARVYGPSAFGGGVRRFVELTLTLARTEFKLRYFGSVLGYFWSLMRPLLFFGVLYVVFTHVFKLGKGIPHYPVYLLTSIVLWNYFLEATTGSVQCLLAREGMLRKVRFPRMVIPLSVSLTAVFNLAMNFIAVFVFALANGVLPKLSWLEMIPIVGAYIVLATGVGMLLCALYVPYRDVQPIWEVLSQVLFYLSPIIYIVAYLRTARLRAPRDAESDRDAQHADGPRGDRIRPALPVRAPRPTARRPSRAPPTVAGGYAHLLAPIGILLGLFCLGWWVFIREAPRVAEHL